MRTCRNYREARQKLSQYYSFRCGRVYVYNGLGWRFSSRMRPHSYSVYSYRETFPIAIALFYGSIYEGMCNQTPDACFINTDRYSHTTSRHQSIVATTMRTGQNVHHCSQEVMRSLDDAMQNFQPAQDSLYEIIDSHVGQIREHREKEIYEIGQRRLHAKADAILSRTYRLGAYHTHRLTYA